MFWEKSDNMYAVVTGGSRGIGFGIVKSLTALGYRCLIAARSLSDEAKALIESGKADYLPCDISDEKSRESLKEYLSELESVDLLVNCAGVAPKIRRDMLEITPDDFDYVLNINQKGTFFVSQLVANIMKNQGKGRIVFISSISSYTASVERAEYCISKASISMYTKLFAARLAEYGIGVFEVSPGVIETDMTKCVKGKYEALIDGGLTPIKRMGQPEDIAKAVEAVALGNLDFCTGTVIQADGGFSVRRL